MIFRAILAAASLIQSTPASACSIPVFRYALERWQPAPYEIAIFRHGELAEPAKQAAQRLDEARSRTNLKVLEFDVAIKGDPPWLKLWKSQEPAAKVPWLTIRYPEADDNSRCLWSGPLTEATVQNLLGSPARREIIAALARGESAVFVLVASGNLVEDEAAARVAEQELHRLQKIIELPMPTPDGPQLLSDLPLRVSFPLLRLSRTDPAERFFLASLLGSDEELAGARGPILVPIFGRGRLLCGLHGEDLCSEQIAKVAHFLCGACSCQVKELNPGVDLLLAADWEALLGTPAAKDEPASAAMLTQPVIPTRQVSAPEPDPAILSTLRAPLWSAIVFAAGLVLATGYWTWRSRRAVGPPSTEES